MTTELNKTAQTVLAVASVLGTLAAVAFPESTPVASIVKVGLSLGKGLVDEIPAAEAAYEKLKTLASTETPITSEQWAALDAGADAAHTELQAAADAVIARG